MQSQPPDQRRPPNTEGERWYRKVIRFLAYVAGLIGGAGG
jgi:hypothetical protein